MSEKIFFKMFFLEQDDKKKFQTDFKKKLDDCLKYSNTYFSEFSTPKNPYIGFENNIINVYNIIEANFNAKMIDDGNDPKVNKELLINTIYFIYKNHFSNFFKDPDEACFFDVIKEMLDDYINKIYWKERYKGIIPLNIINSFLKDVLNLIKNKIKYAGSFKYLKLIN